MIVRFTSFCMKTGKTEKPVFPCINWCEQIAQNCLEKEHVEEMYEKTHEKTSVTLNTQTIFFKLCTTVIASKADCVNDFPINSTIQLKTIEVSKTCGDSQFSCGDGICIDSKWRCDGNKDCANWNDEKNCSLFCT